MALDHDRLVKPVKKLRKLVGHIGNEPSPDEVHDLRTNSRRFEAMFDALCLETKGIGKSTLKHLKRLRGRAGKVRDMDVLTSFASTVRPEGEEECAVQLLEHLGAERLKFAGALHSEIQRFGPDLRKELKRSSGKLNRLIRKAAAPDGSAAVEKAVANAATLALGLAVPRHLDQDNLHPYRLKVKKLRNVLKMAARTSDAGFVDDLGKVKDAIGEWHDWQELVRIAQKDLKHGKACGLVVELKRITQQKYEDALARAQELRGTYLHEPLTQNGTSSGWGKVPASPVWDTIALLAA